MADGISNGVNATEWYQAQQAAAATQRDSSVKEATLGMKDFLVLLVAQLQNQDIMNPMENTEFVAQMATFSQMTAINTMAEQSMTAYAVSLLGKEVTVAEINPITGGLETLQGTVTGISLFETNPKIYIGDRSFFLQSIMSVGQLPNVKTPGGSDYSIDPEPNTSGNLITRYNLDDAGKWTFIESDKDGVHVGLWTWNAEKEAWEFSKHTPGGGYYNVPPVPYVIGNGIRLDKPDDDGRNTYAEFGKDDALYGIWTWSVDQWRWMFEKHTPAEVKEPADSGDPLDETEPQGAIEP